eukprot:scaffold7545_cov42-Phaeocystis_antarctica.AAC.1
MAGAMNWSQRVMSSSSSIFLTPPGHMLNLRNSTAGDSSIHPALPAVPSGPISPRPALSASALPKNDARLGVLVQLGLFELAFAAAREQKDILRDGGGVFTSHGGGPLTVRVSVDGAQVAACKDVLQPVALQLLRSFHAHKAAAVEQARDRAVGARIFQVARVGRVARCPD